MSGSVDQNWKKISSALSPAGLQMLDSDNSLGVFFVVDVANTKGKISTHSPIYRINLIKKDKQTIVTLTNQRNKPVSDQLQFMILQRLTQTIKS